MDDFIHPATDPQIYTPDDIGLSMLYAENFRNCLLYAAKDGDDADGKWYSYDGKRWQPDNLRVRQNLAERFARFLKRNSPYSEQIAELHARQQSMETKDEKGEVKVIGDKSEVDNVKAKLAILENMQKKWDRRISALHDLAGQRNLLAMAVNKLLKCSSDLDVETNLLNVENCTLDIKPKGKRKGAVIRQQNPTDYITKLANVSYNKNADPTIWNQFASDIMCGREDLMRFFQRVCGYILSGNVVEKKFFILYGPNTNNGKSTFISILREIFGDYTAMLKSESVIEQRFSSSSAPNPDITKLQGVRLVLVDEIPEHAKLDSNRLKQFTGSRAGLTGKQMYGEEITFKIQFNLIIALNEWGQINDNSVFRSGRAMLIPFDADFTGDNDNKDIDTLLRQPEVKQAALNWMIQGYADYLKYGLGEVPHEISALIDSYSYENNPIRRFVDDCLIESKNDKIIWSSRTDFRCLKNIYHNWCTDNDVRPESTLRISKKFKEMGMYLSEYQPGTEKKTGGNKKYLWGWMLREGI